jgi:hypothetical protein
VDRSEKGTVSTLRQTLRIVIWQFDKTSSFSTGCEKQGVETDPFSRSAKDRQLMAQVLPRSLLGFRGKACQ